MDNIILLTLGISLPMTFMPVCLLPVPLYTRYLVTVTTQFIILCLSTRQYGYK
jgi:hypothetical protein